MKCQLILDEIKPGADHGRAKLFLYFQIKRKSSLLYMAFKIKIIYFQSSDIQCLILIFRSKHIIEKIPTNLNQAFRWH